MTQLPAFIVDEKFDLRRFLHGKRLVCFQMLFDSRPSEILTTYGRWDSNKRYPRSRTKHYDEQIYTTAIVKHRETHYTICFSLPGKVCQSSLEDQHIFNRIPPWVSHASDWWRRTNEWYSMHYYSENIFPNQAFEDFEFWILNELVRHRGYTLERQMKRKATKVVDVPPTDRIMQVTGRDEPFDFGFNLQQSFFRTNRRIDIEL